MKINRFKKQIKTGIASLLLTAIIPCLLSAALTIVKVETKDSGGSSRSYFSSTERITLAIKVNNSQTDSGRIVFSFAIKDPSGRRVFYQTGNMSPGTAGTSGSEIRNLAIEKFFESPGFYILEAVASLNNASVSGISRFQVSSPIITLSYPPTNSRNLAVQPLTFRWVSSGASKYRIYVGPNQSLSLNAFTADVEGTSFTYPDNPANDQHRMVSGQVYYWKIEGIGTTGNVIARTPVPFSFSVLLGGSQVTRDVAVKRISVGNDPLGPGFVPIKVDIKNQGSQSESAITVQVYINGMPINRDKKITRIEPGKIHCEVFPVRIPEVSDQVLVTASHDLFDDNVGNNQLSRILSEQELFPTKRESGPAYSDLSEIWEQVKRALKQPRLVSQFDGYTLYAIEPDGTAGEELLKQFLEGKAKVGKTTVTIQR